MKDQYLEECKSIQQNCTYTAETHHLIANKQKRLAFWYQVVPAVIAAILGVLVGTGAVPTWYVWLSVLSAVVSAVGNVLNPLKEYYDHLNAAKHFTVLKQDARALCSTFSLKMTDEELGASVKSLHDRYNDLVRFVPPTDPKIFEEARKNVQRGIHELD